MMDLIVKIFFWVMVAGAGIGLMPLLIGYAKDSARIAKIGKRIVFITGVVGCAGIWAMVIIKCFA